MNFLEILNQPLELTQKERGLLKILEINHKRAIDVLLYLPYKYHTVSLLFGLTVV